MLKKIVRNDDEFPAMEDQFTVVRCSVPRGFLHFRWQREW